MIFKIQAAGYECGTNVSKPQIEEIRDLLDLGLRFREATETFAILNLHIPAVVAGLSEKNETNSS